jgi:hypothetical protein
MPLLHLWVFIGCSRVNFTFTVTFNTGRSREEFFGKKVELRRPQIQVKPGNH